MTGLRRVLLAKIIITILAWALPLLVLPASALVSLGFPMPEPAVFLRLLGTAYCALVVGYMLGLIRVRRNEYPLETVWVGIVSNGGATLVLAAAAFLGTWSDWGLAARAYMWFSFVAVASITAGLVITGPMRADSRRDS